MKKNAFLINISLLMLTLIGFFSFLIGNIYYLLVIAIVPVAFYIFSSIMSVDKENLAWLVFLLFLWISALFSNFSSFCYRYILGFAIILALKLIFESVCGWQKKFSRYFYLCSIIHVAAIVLCLVIPTTIRDFASSFMTGENYTDYITLFNNGAYAGLTYQTGYAAYFSSILLGLSLCSVMCENKKGKNFLFVLISVLAVFLTMKRSFLVSNAVAIVICFFINNKTDKNKFKTFFKYLFLFLIAWCIISAIPEARNVFLKAERLSQAEDVSNGRFDLWSQTIELWKDSPVFGLGISTLGKAYGTVSHNVYLQLLAETGVCGLISFIVAIVMTFYKSCKLYLYLFKKSLVDSAERSLYLACIYIQAVFIVYCFTGNPLYDFNFLILYIISVACIKSKQNERKSKISQKQNA